MDESLRNSLRLLQRSGGDFSELKLHEFMNIDQLHQLLHHVMIAKLRLMGLSFVYSDKPPGHLNVDQDGKEPRIIARPIPSTGVNAALTKLPKTMDEISEIFTGNLLRIGTGVYNSSAYGGYELIRQEVWCWHSSNTPDWWVKTGENDWYSFSIVAITKELQTVFETHAKKRLRERGLIPGKNG